jgi:hypothetical protein
MHREMEPVLAAVGIKLETHNLGMGANNCIPYNLCLEAQGGRDPDFLSWEQGYNCGHSEDVWELVGRTAAFSSNHAFMFYEQSGTTCTPR